VKPIVFNTEMVQAILDGRRSQFRKAIKFGEYIYDIMNENCIEVSKNYCDMDKENHPELKKEMIKHSKYQVNDIIYVKETFLEGYIESGYDTPHEDDYGIFNGDNGVIIYKADHVDNTYFNNLDAEDREDRPTWKPSIHMPKEYSRIFLKVNNVRVERLRDITYEDKIKEGILCDGEIGTRSHIDDVEESWYNLWNKTAKQGYKWEDNPYVFVYEFEIAKKSIK